MRRIALSVLVMAAAACGGSAHSNANCSNTAPRGGAGRIYCFARN
ncbi:MAG TPA: hypothetical protein VKC35_08845 [Vicinamibacterales bacterium]|nr:hypothetical protein [Vicinamibacterales bacterium]